MRALIIDNEAKVKIFNVVEHAAKNHYRPGPGVPPPGDDDRFVANLGTYRCVFSYTHSDGKLWRHISMSVPSSQYPNPAAAFTIATEFGFAGWDKRTLYRAPDGWLIDLKKDEHCVVLAQEIASR